ncbi:FGGY-family carbohydrate kinase [Bifidobacterium sp.]|jgi:L-xylulokinase|uniref:FGGY-family carbohydrate kinase n=1 Tax=Bifidobacterium sp. TaxID=41200 RepID=UPI0025BB65C7|nr:FGGY-family carbohydrate kinase [Bifidobacterium sp.]MCI1634985.1 carbohydrate kinase [Bifidobacterium sp.]
MEPHSPRRYLTLDNGGTNTKALLFDDEGRMLAKSSFATDWIQPQPSMREIDLHTLKDSIFSVIRTVLSNAGISGSEVDCITCVGHGKGLYTLDKTGRVRHRGILSTDNRAKALTTEFERRVETIYPISSQHVMPSQAPVLLRWLKEHSPDVYSDIGTVFSAKDFVRFLLSGDIHQEIADASGNNLVNLHTREYDPRLFEFFGIDEALDWMPPLVEAESLVSSVDSTAAAQTGLTEGTPITGGLFDIDAGTLGMGVLDTSRFGIIAGTWNINVYPVAEPCACKPGIMNSLFAARQILTEASSPTSAGNLDIILRLLMPDRLQLAQTTGTAIYDELERVLNASRGEPSPVVYFPFLYGSNSDPYASAGFLGIDSTTTREHLIMAVYEGIVFAHRQHIDQLRAVCAGMPPVARVSGGAANSAAWMQLFADVLKIRIETLRQKESSGLGGAIVSAVATGRYPSLIQAVRHMVEVAHAYEPDEVSAARYAEKYDTYQDMLGALSGHWDGRNGAVGTKATTENEV